MGRLLIAARPVAIGDRHRFARHAVMQTLQHLHQPPPAGGCRVGKSSGTLSPHLQQADRTHCRQMTETFGWIMSNATTSSRRKVRAVRRAGKECGGGFRRRGVKALAGPMLIRPILYTLKTYIASTGDVADRLWQIPVRNGQGPASTVVVLPLGNRVARRRYHRVTDHLLQQQQLYIKQRYKFRGSCLASSRLRRIPVTVSSTELLSRVRRRGDVSKTDLNCHRITQGEKFMNKHRPCARRSSRPCAAPAQPRWGEPHRPARATGSRWHYAPQAITQFFNSQGVDDETDASHSCAGCPLLSLPSRAPAADTGNEEMKGMFPAEETGGLAATPAARRQYPRRRRRSLPPRRRPLKA